jgi:hypothetical protein
MEQNLKPIKNNTWVDDDKITTCHKCEKEFGFFLRKHHCRSCGNIFCYLCVNYTVSIPDILNRPVPRDYWNLSYYVPLLKGYEEKVCQQCYSTIQENFSEYDKSV